MHFFGSDENRKDHNTDLDKSGECLQRYYIIRTNKKWQVSHNQEVNFFMHFLAVTTAEKMKMLI